MKNRLIIAMLSAGCLFNSCEDDDVSLETFTFTIPSNYEASVNESWVFITDADGNSHDVQPIENGRTLTVNIPSNARRPLAVNFFNAEIHIDQVVRNIHTYVGVTPGAYEIFQREQSLTSNQASVDLSLQNFPAESSLFITGDIVAYGRLGDNVETYVDTKDVGYARLLACVFGTQDDVRYKLFDAFADETYSINYNELPSFNNTHLELPPGAPSVRLYGNEGGKQFLILASEWPASGTSTPVTLYDGGSAFDSYHTLLTLNVSDDLSYYNDHFGNSVPNSFEILNASAQLDRQDDQGFSISTTGSADALQTAFADGELFSDGKIYIDRRVIYLPFEKKVTFNHPKIPDTLKELYFQNGVKIFALGGALITDMPTEDFEGFLAARIGAENQFVDIKWNSRRKWMSF